MRRTPWSVLVLALAASACAPAVAVPEPAPAAPAYDCPPAAERPGMIRLTDAAPTIREDIRYATANNFTGHALPGYEDPAALMRPDAAAALARVQERLRRQGYGLKVWDAYRPVRATQPSSNHSLPVVSAYSTIASVARTGRYASHTFKP